MIVPAALKLSHETGLLFDAYKSIVIKNDSIESIALTTTTQRTQ